MNEIQRLQQLAGILTEIKVNNPSSPISEEIKEYLADLYDQTIPEDGNEGELQNITLEREEYGDEDSYDDAYMFDEAYNTIRNKGGKITIDDFDPEMSFSINGDDIILNYIL